MALYSVNAVRISEGGDIQALRGFETNGSTRAVIGSERVFSIPELLGLITQGDSFDLSFIGENGGKVSGGLILPDGRGSARAERGGQDREVIDLPRF